jgi:hypothetical protein
MCSTDTVCSLDSLIEKLYALSDEELIPLLKAIGRGYLKVGHTDTALIEIYLPMCFLEGRASVVMVRSRSGATKIAVALYDLNSLKSIIGRFTARGVAVERVLPHCGVIVSSPIPRAAAETIARSISRTAVHTRYACGDQGNRKIPIAFTQ